MNEPRKNGDPTWLSERLDQLEKRVADLERQVNRVEAKGVPMADMYRAMGLDE